MENRGIDLWIKMWKIRQVVTGQKLPDRTVADSVKCGDLWVEKKKIKKIVMTTIVGQKSDALFKIRQQDRIL